MTSPLPPEALRSRAPARTGKTRRIHSPGPKPFRLERSEGSAARLGDIAYQGRRRNPAVLCNVWILRQRLHLIASSSRS